jgi:hypothetical protein
MKSCVLFSSYIPEKNINVGLWYINILKTYFSDCDIYYGIAEESCSKWKELLKDFQYKSICPIDKSVHSDASGFIYALKMLIDYDKDYDNIWIIHTKGASYNSINQSNDIRNYYLTNLFKKRNIVENKLVGCYGSASTDLLYHPNKSITNFWNDFEELKNDIVIDYFFPNTIYVLRYDIIKNFIKKHIDEIISKLYILDDKRYFFEAYFSGIVDKLGYKPIKVV